MKKFNPIFVALIVGIVTSTAHTSSPIKGDDNGDQLSRRNFWDVNKPPFSLSPNGSIIPEGMEEYTWCSGIEPPAHILKDGDFKVSVWQGNTREDIEKKFNTNKCFKVISTTKDSITYVEKGPDEFLNQYRYNFTTNTREELPLDKKFIHIFSFYNNEVIKAGETLSDGGKTVNLWVKKSEQDEWMLVHSYPRSSFFYYPHPSLEFSDDTLYQFIGSPKGPTVYAIDLSEQTLSAILHDHQISLACASTDNGRFCCTLKKHAFRWEISEGKKIYNSPNIDVWMNLIQAHLKEKGIENNSLTIQGISVRSFASSVFQIEVGGSWGTKRVRFDFVEDNSREGWKIQGNYYGSNEIPTQLTSQDQTAHKKYYEGNGTVPYFLTKPLNSKRPNSFPTILLIHGGPATPVFSDIHPLTNYFAQKGFAVVEPLFRFSQNTNELFISGFGEYGHGAIEDNIEVINHLIQEQVVDPKEVFVFGHSYGGYASLRMMTGARDDFSKAMGFEPRAFIAMSCVSDCLMECDRSLKDPEYTLGDYHSRYILGPQRVNEDGTLKEGTTEYLKSISPINNPILTAPLLMIQSIQDDRIRNSQLDLFHEAVMSHNSEYLGTKDQKTEQYVYARVDTSHGFQTHEWPKTAWVMETFMSQFIDLPSEIEPLTQKEEEVSSLTFVYGGGLVN